MFLIIASILIIVFLTGAFLVTAVNSAFRRIHKRDVKQQLKSIGKLFFYRPLHLLFFPSHEYEGLFFATICAQNIIRFCYVATMLVFLSHTDFFYQTFPGPDETIIYGWNFLWLILSLVIFILLAFSIGDYLPRILGAHFPEAVLRWCAPLASPFLLLMFPFIYIFLKISRSLLRTAYLDLAYGPVGKQEIIDMLQKAEAGLQFDVHEKKLIESVVTFKEKIAREVMVPRVDMFSLSADTPIIEAAKFLQKEGYSRTPIYQNTVDNIVGVLMYKDILNKYMEYQQKNNDLRILQEPIDSIKKNVLHAPETKKISSLLQEFRKRQVHLAIVVDEYGGTEGIVTIEDILEQIVGEIADEYDQERELFYSQGNNIWIVDARMNILDVEEELMIVIPQEGEYDTIGGYIFHTTGAIPPKGFVIHHNDFDMEILESNDRCVEKVRIKALSTPPTTEENSSKE